MSLWHEIGSQLAHPSGIGGRVIGGFMRFVNDKTNKAAVERLGIEPGDTVLELGCGPGHGIGLAASLASPGIVHGLDQSVEMLRQARHRNHRAMEDGRVRLHWGVFEALPFEDESIDRMLAVNVIYFWHNLSAVAAEVLRVLRPGGRLSIYATDRESMRHWKFALTGTHRLFDADRFAAELEAEGFVGCSIDVTHVRIAKRVTGLIAVITKVERGEPKIPR